MFEKGGRHCVEVLNSFLVLNSDSVQNNINNNIQHGFSIGKSTTANLWIFYCGL